MDNQLEEYRKEIDEIDGQIGDLLKRRLQKVQEIAKIKAELGIPIEHSDREAEVLKKLDSQYQKEIFKTVILESKKAQEPLTTED